METTKGYINKDEITGDVWLSNRNRMNQKNYANGSCFIPCRASLLAKIAKHLGMENTPTEQKELLMALSDKYGIGLNAFDFKILKSDEAVADSGIPEAQAYIKQFERALKDAEKMGVYPSADTLKEHINKCPENIREALFKRFLPDKVAEIPTISFLK